MKNFIKVDDLAKDEIYAIINRANSLHECWKNNTMPKTLKNKKIALWFYGQGFRNRVAFEIGARALGADISFIPGELGVNEPVEDITQYLNNWFSMVVIRCKKYKDLKVVVKDSAIPIINARTSFNHPCEIIGDLQYINKMRSSIDNLKVVFIGELTNLCMSWFEAARVLPIDVVQVGPEKYLGTSSTIENLNKNAVGHISVSATIEGIITKETDVLYTDCWPKADNKEKVREAFFPYQITKSVVNNMNPKGFFMPCPPVTRGEEISEDSLTAPQYCNYQAKEYLLHSQNAIMEYCFNEKFV